LNRWAKAGLVCGGYVLALVAAGVASYLYNLRVSALPYDTSGGMYAAGEFMTALGTFLVIALVPTLLMLWFLRGHARLWQAIALGSVGFAGVGLLAVLMTLVARGTARDPFVVLLNLFGLAQLLGVPLWTVAFVLFAFLAPTRKARRLLVVAIGLECVIGVCAAFHWLVPSSPL
jgi:hypothetical protein